MPQPFPGMDPWLEHPDLWPDVHNSLITTIRDHLGPQLAPEYVVRLEERTYLVEGWELEFLGRPDVTIAGRRRVFESRVTLERTHREEEDRGITVTIPIPDETSETYLEIRLAATREVVTVLEILSATNKISGEGRRNYIEKRLRLAGTRTGLVEIDLVRAGEPMPVHGPGGVTDYRILIRRPDRSSRATLLPFGVRDAIPVFHVPLLKEHAWPELDVGALLGSLYDRARYDLSIDYSSPPIPPLSGPERSWARRILRGKTRSPRRR